MDISCKLSDVAKPTGGSLAAPIDGELTTGGLNDVVEWRVSGRRGDWSGLGLLLTKTDVPLMEEAPGLIEPINLSKKW